MILSQARVQVRRPKPKRKLRLGLGRILKMSHVTTATKKDMIQTNAQNPRRAEGAQEILHLALALLPLLVAPGVLPHPALMPAVQAQAP